MVLLITSMLSLCCCHCLCIVTTVTRFILAISIAIFLSTGALHKFAFIKKENKKKKKEKIFLKVDGYNMNECLVFF